MLISLTFDNQYYFPSLLAYKLFTFAINLFNNSLKVNIHDLLFLFASYSIFHSDKWFSKKIKTAPILWHGFSAI